MKTDEKYLSFHIECMENGWLADGIWGLCGRYCSFPGTPDPIFELFIPTSSERDKLERDGYSREYWASDSIEHKRGIYTPLRQTIVLFMAAINDEL